ncbi:MAG: putative quinol monooxygenase [Ilumatobacter sp.]|jgi:quinol monooxygenase YgiN|uniref:putative quinol monooxygenase n=1 Tax=Ilumatobacter sp. TaxID=1967498 RepID=UPI00391C778A
MIIITATLSFETQADRDRAVAATADVQRATRDEEPGCLAYCFAADPVEPTHVQVYELWDDADRLAAHFDHRNYAQMVDVLRTSGGFVASDNRLYAVADRGPVYDGTGAFRREAVADGVS